MLVGEKFKPTGKGNKSELGGGEGKVDVHVRTIGHRAAPSSGCIA